jgi:hypothetical protein
MGFDSEVDSMLHSGSRAVNLGMASGRKWRIRAQHIRPKLRRGATNETSIAVVKLARTTSDRRLAIRRVRAETCVGSARVNTSLSKTITTKTASEYADSSRIASLLRVSKTSIRRLLRNQGCESIAPTDRGNDGTFMVAGAKET